MRPLLRECLAEVIGTFVLVFFGLGAVHAAVLFDAHVGLWQVASIWGAAVAMAIYAVGAVSGAHLNPAITLPLAVFRDFPWRKVGPYCAAQFAGAFLAAATLYLLLSGAIGEYERQAGLARGEAGSQRSAMLYADYFPNPAIVGVDASAWRQATLWHALWGEFIGTAALALIVFAATDRRSQLHPPAPGVPVMIALGLAMIIAVLAPLTMAGLNPARDFGPRLLAYFAGWGPIAIPGPRGGFFTVYIVAPLLGGVAGAGLYHFGLHAALPRDDDAK